MAETTLSSVTKMRLLDEMLGGTKVENQWAILLLDPVTTSIMSSIAGVSDLLDFGVSLVDNVLTPREPMPHMTGIYFISPCESSVRAVLNDFPPRGKPLYRTIHIFFSSSIDAGLLDPIRKNAKLVERLATLKEVNLEFALYPDNRSFTTNQENALQSFFSSYVDATDDYKTEVEKMATRIATIFSTMKEFPTIRYRAALPPGDEYPPGLESRLLLAQRLAVEVYDRLLALQKTGQVPERESCDLIIMDRGFDPVAPIIHEWTYEAMTHDLLEGAPMLNGKIFTFEARTEGGGRDMKEHALDDRDATFRGVRHRHFAAATVKITSSLNELRSKSHVATRPTSLGDMDLKNMSKLVQALPQYREQLAELAVHIELASLLNRMVEQHHLTEVGRLEQDLVYGDANSKDVIAYLSANQVMPVPDKVRLLMCYCATHQEKLDATKQAQWQKIARIGPTELATVINLEYLGVPVCKRSKGGLTAAMTFGRKRKRAIRKDREPDENDQQYALTRFVPMLSEVIEDAVTGKLSQDEYPYVRPPSCAPLASAAYASNAPGVASFRTVKSATWLKRNAEKQDGISRGSRVYSFIIGGFTFSELRSVHRLSTKLGRDVMVGGTSVITPNKFMQQVLNLGGSQEYDVGSASSTPRSYSSSLNSTPKAPAVATTPRNNANSRRW